MGGLLCLVSRTGHQNIHYTRAFHAICKDAYGVGYLTIGDLVAFVVVKPFECPHVLWRKLTYGKLFLGNCGYRHYIGTQISHGKSFLPYAAMIVITPLGMVISCSVENVNSLCLSLRLFTFPCGFDSRTVDLIKSPFQGRASLTWHPSGSRRLAPPARLMGFVASLFTPQQATFTNPRDDARVRDRPLDGHAFGFDYSAVDQTKKALLKGELH